MRSKLHLICCLQATHPENMPGVSMIHVKEFYRPALQPYDLLTEIALPFMKGTNGRNYLATCGVLQYIAMRTSLHGTLNILTGMVHRKDGHFRVWTGFANPSCGFNSVHDRH